MTDFDELRRLQDEYAQASPTRRRTIRQHITIQSGRHPATKMPLAGNGQTCGTCGNCQQIDWHTRRYYKCGLMPNTYGPGSDIRLSWPACTQWAPTRDTAPGMTIDELLGPTT